jgi:hypothetical protein
MEPQERSLRTRNTIIGVVLLAVVALAAWLWLRSGSPQPEAIPVAPPAVADLEPEPVEEEAPAEGDARRRAWIDVMGAPPLLPANLDAVESCDAIRNDVARICAALDSRAPELRGEGGACTLLEQLAAELAANPPDIASELSSYDTILDNVFHLFRVAGRERVGALRRLLEERELAEPAALTLYRWASHHRRCGPDEGPRISGPTLYAYAGFLFNTMGGQAYLRRRTPQVEGLACFYALQALDRSVRQGHNPEGIDPRPEFPRCRELVATEGLLLSERYAEELDAMAARWEDGRP